MPRPKKHIFVCTQARPPGHPRGSCAERDCQPVMQAFMEQFEERGLYGLIGLTNAGCLGACDEGTCVLVYPESVMYGKVTKEDVDEILDEHILGDKPVERLKVSEEVW